MTGVRYDRALGEFVGRCDDCREFWPLTREFWRVDKAATACRACHAERIKDASRRYREARKRVSFSVVKRRRRNREWMRSYRARKKAAA